MNRLRTGLWSVKQIFLHDLNSVAWNGTFSIISIACFHLYSGSDSKVNHVQISIVLGLKNPCIDLRGDVDQPL
jgi:hypothetical protein